MGNAPGAQADRRAEGPVVVGVNGSAGSVAALRWAAGEACMRGTGLRIVCAWQRPGPGRPEHDRPAEPARIALMRVQKALARVLRELCFPARITCATPHGPAGSALLAEVGEGNLLVLGTRPPGSALAPGRTGRYCLRHRRGPLVFVPARPSREVPTASGRTEAGTTARSDALFPAILFQVGPWCMPG